MGTPSIDIACPTNDEYTFYRNGQRMCTLRCTDYCRINDFGGYVKFEVNPVLMTDEGKPAAVKFRIKNTSGYDVVLRSRKGEMWPLRGERQEYEVDLVPEEEYEYLSATEVFGEYKTDS
ncbi:hypothetical protein D3C76_783420 [compost metagenome]|uniref:Uncharacterized protein n=1 Tax=Pseudomonas wadenswilerensis TaxID=1785161 RepID=A0A380T1H8_9PSED|nr:MULTISPECIES: hypothetical protein [Pseudomonas]MCE5984429.1 hypothetical protein [Pseudomonas sp. LF19]SUQ63430.1 hypothetical protein CCOS864_02880 [Pseudomonas wadenswilerensis]